MRSTADKASKRTFTAIDLFIILLLLLCVAGAVLRVFGINGILYGGKSDSYYVSYEISGAKGETGDYFTEGAVFCTEDGEAFGTVTGEVITTPAKVYTENNRGEYVEGYTTGTEIDIRGTLSVKGRMQDKGFLSGGRYYCPNMKVRILRPGVSAEILITDIVKAS